MTSCYYASNDSYVTTTKICTANSQCCYVIFIKLKNSNRFLFYYLKIQSNENSYTADCSSKCFESTSSSLAYCNSNNCNTISLVPSVTKITTIASSTTGKKCKKN